MCNVPNNKLIPKVMNQRIIVNPMLIKPSCISEAEKYFDNIQRLSKQCANANLQNVCMFSIPKGFVSVTTYANEVSKFYAELDEMYYGQNVNSDARELYRELCEKSL